MASPQTSTEDHHDEFSLPLFAFTVLTTLAGLFAVLWLAFPSLWAMQWVATPLKAVVAFLGVSVLNCFFEYFFHRYVLHTAALPLIGRLYRQHTLHHALTRIAKKKTSHDARGVMYVENKFPIVEPEQHEASFFPWYSMAVFAVLLSPILAVLQWLLPEFPWFAAGFAALATSLALYEILHAINHWAFEKWEPLIFHRFFGRFWRPVYAFHLRHHAVIDCNESISGFFGLPIADLTFGTLIIPKTIYADGEEWTPEKFQSPRPIWPIRKLDTLFAARVAKFRAAAVSKDSKKKESAAADAPRISRNITVQDSSL